MPDVKRVINTLCWGLICVVAVAGVFGVWWTVSRVDREMRTELLQKTHMFAEAVSIGPIRTLTGTAADITSPTYLQIKEQLSIVKEANPQYRFV